MYPPPRRHGPPLWAILLAAGIVLCGLPVIGLAWAWHRAGEMLRQEQARQLPPPIARPPIPDQALPAPPAVAVTPPLRLVWSVRYPTSTGEVINTTSTRLRKIVLVYSHPYFDTGQLRVEKVPAADPVSGTGTIEPGSRVSFGIPESYSRIERLNILAEQETGAGWQLVQLPYTEESLRR